MAAAVTAIYPTTTSYFGKSRGPSGPCSLVLKDADLAHLFDDTASFVAKQSLERPSGDILALLVRAPGDGLGNPRTFRRSADTWSDGAAPLAPGDARLLTTLLETLANSPAAAVLLTPPADFESIASLTALGLSDANLGDLSVGTATSPAAWAEDPEGNQSKLAARSDTFRMGVNALQSMAILPGMMGNGILPRRSEPNPVRITGRWSGSSSGLLMVGGDGELVGGQRPGGDGLGRGDPAPRRPGRSDVTATSLGSWQLRQAWIASTWWSSSRRSSKSRVTAARSTRTSCPTPRST